MNSETATVIGTILSFLPPRAHRPDGVSWTHTLHARQSLTEPWFGRLVSRALDTPLPILLPTQTNARPFAGLLAGDALEAGAQTDRSCFLEKVQPVLKPPLGLSIEVDGG